MKRAEIVASARKWLGKKWTHQGRGDKGIDCAGLGLMVARDFDLEFQDMFGYRRSPDDQTFLRHIQKFLPQGVVRAISDGSVGIFAQQGYACHVGIFSTLHDQKHLIHADSKRGRVVEEPYDVSVWPGRLIDVRDYPGVED